jgi:GTPase SAR1 family protein
VVVFDRANRQTFEGVEFWMEGVKNQVDQKAIFLLLGNKSDLQPVVSTEEAQDLAEKHGMRYIETSALNNHQISMAFELIIREFALEEV